MSTAPGLRLRRLLFWFHLGCGVCGGLIILLMSATGVLLAYEHQLVDRAAQRNESQVPSGTLRLSADELAARARALAPDVRLSLTVDANPAAPVTVTAGRDTVALLNPYTGAAIVDAAAGRRAFFAQVERLHRWMGGDARGTGATLIDLANLLFLLLTITGSYLWLPPVWRWRTLRGLLLFRTRYVNSRARDFSWHHVLGAWALVPLFLIALSGVVMSYPWANRLLFAAFGEPAPQRAGAPRTASPAREHGQLPNTSLQSLVDVAMAQDDRWERITVPASVRGDRVEITLELQSSARRAPRRTLVLGATDARVIAAPPAQATMQTPAQRARSWLRFVHTGEEYGLAGQSVAALASLAACLLAYSGLALAWRRLIVPLYRRA